jgi:large subunit ribosomal protein L31
VTAFEVSVMRVHERKSRARVGAKPWYHIQLAGLGRNQGTIDPQRSLFMKKGIHPEYVECTVRCTCGNTFKTRSTKPEITVELCNKCHPFYTGQQKFVDTGGRVQRFSEKFGSAAAATLKKAEDAKAAKAAKAAEAEAAAKAEREAKKAEKAKRAAEFAKKAEAEAAKQAAEAPAEETEQAAEPAAQTAEASAEAPAAEAPAAE